MKTSDSTRNGIEVAYSRLNVMVVGNERSGKSSTIRSLLKQSFDRDLSSTLEAEPDKNTPIKVHHCSSKWKVADLGSNWLSAEMGEYLKKLENQFEKRETSRNKKNLLPTGDEDDFSADLLAKLNLNNEEMETNVKNAIDENRTKGFNRENEGDDFKVTIWDFNGQERFLPIQNIFLRSGGIYIVVFDVTAMLEQRDEEVRAINSWLHSIELQAPGATVIMVGTRCNQVEQDDLKMIDSHLNKKLESVNVNYREADGLSFFAIDNADEESIEDQIEPLRAILLAQTKPSTKEAEAKLSQKSVPLKWIVFMNHLVNKFECCIRADQLFQLGKQMNLDRDEDIMPMLELYKDAGAIIPFMKGSKNAESLISDYIVLSPEWLMKVLGSIIYDPQLHSKKKSLMKKKYMGRLVANYEKTGILSKKLLLCILNQVNVKEYDYEFIIPLCQEMLIMSRLELEPKWFTIPNDTFFLVPTMNQRVMTKERIQEEQDAKDMINIFLHFERSIPVGLFERVISLMLSCNREFDGTTMEPTITRNYCMSCFRETEVFLVDEPKNGDLRISLSKEEESELKSIMTLLEIGSKVQEKLKSDALGKHLAFSLEIESADGNDNFYRCKVEDLLRSVSNHQSKVKMTGSNGRQKLKKISQLELFGEAAQVIVERQKQQKEDKKLVWEYDVFLAHTWGHNNETHEQVVKINELLKARKFRTWLDEANLKYFVSNDIVDGLRNSSCVLVFITEQYLERVENADTNAAKEFAEAVRKGSKYLVPVVLDPKCLDPMSWAGSTVGYYITDSLYFDFSSEEKIKANFEGFCERIEEMSTAERHRSFSD